MDERNVDFEVPLTDDQWNQVAQTAGRLSKDWGVEWSDEDRERIEVYLRAEEARGAWERYVGGGDGYASDQMRVAEIRFNGGRPYARLQPPSSAREPAIDETELRAMDAGLERFVRDRWGQLLDESGLQFTRGRVPTDLPEPE